MAPFDIYFRTKPYRPFGSVTGNMRGSELL